MLSDSIFFPNSLESGSLIYIFGFTLIFIFDNWLIMILVSYNMITIKLTCDFCKETSISDIDNIESKAIRLNWKFDNAKWSCPKCLNKIDIPQEGLVVAVSPHGDYAIITTAKQAERMLKDNITVIEIPEDFDFTNPILYEAGYWYNMIEEGYVRYYEGEN